ncbi:hypothetical protein QFC22_006749, partial [Naganishia vaughanmartiniae]
MQNQLQGWKGYVPTIQLPWINEPLLTSDPRACTLSKPDFHSFKTQAKAKAFMERVGGKPPTTKDTNEERKIEKPHSKRVSKTKPEAPIRVYPAAEEDIPYHENPAFLPWPETAPAAIIKTVDKKRLPIARVRVTSVSKKSQYTPSLPANHSVTSVRDHAGKQRRDSASVVEAVVGQSLPVDRASVMKVPNKGKSLLAPPAIRPVKSRSFYAVKKGIKRGVYTTWAECKANVQAYNKGGSGPIFKKFPTSEEATAWLDGAIPRGSQVDPVLPDSLRWDGIDVEATNSSAGFPETVLSRLQQARSQGFTTTEDGALVVYTDGSAKDNRKKGAKAGSGVWWGKHGTAKACRLSERVPGPLQTNNIGEMIAIIRALETCPYPDLPLEIRTDSRYCIDCIHSFFPIWLERGFNNMIGESVKNQDLIVHLLTLLSQRQLANGVRFKHIRAHRGEVGNEGADRLAVKGNKKSALPDRNNWFTMKELNRHRRQQAIRLAQVDIPKLNDDIRPSVATRSGMSVESQIRELLEEIECHEQRLAKVGSAANRRANDGSAQSEAVVAEFRELKELVDVDVD